MFLRYHSLIALLSVALHLLDLVVVAGHQHVHAPGETCVAHRHAHHEHASADGHEHHAHGHCHAHSHEHHCHSPAKTCSTASCSDTASENNEQRPTSAPHDDCVICQHLALTPALVSPASPMLSPTGSEPVIGEIATLLPPLRTIECRSRAPPASHS